MLAPPGRRRSRRLRATLGLSRERWAAFYRRNWERQGLVLSQPLAASLATPADAFRCLLAASEAYRVGDRSFALEFCIEHAQLLADVGAHLPTEADGSAKGYADRMAGLLEGRRFGLVVEDFQAFDAELWQRLREFLHGVFAHTGIPGEAAKATLFLGNYRCTPFGLHRGRSSNFMFVIEGRKRILAWPDAFFRGKPDLTNRTDYGSYLADATTLEADPGDVIYWPPDYWHVGEDTGGLSTAISVMLFMEPAASARLAAQTTTLIGDTLDRRPHKPLRARHVPAMVERSARALRGLLHGSVLRQRLAIGWLDHVSGLGFHRAPGPLAAARLRDDDVVRGDPRFPILWLRTSSREALGSASGQAFRLAAHPRLLRLLARLNTGAPLRVGALVAGHSGRARTGRIVFEASADDVRSLLDHLRRIRAIRPT